MSKCKYKDIADSLDKDKFLMSTSGWFNKSKAEDEFYNDLLLKYDESDVIRQYHTDPRYPFNCDFYIKSEDLFIEFNRFWHHGPHRFDSSNNEDIKLLEFWKSKDDGCNLYHEAIITWTERDIKKFLFAEKNNLNYKVIY